MTLLNQDMKLFLASLTIVVLAGCSSTGGGYFKAISSVDTLELSAPAATAIADDIAGYIAQNVGPGTVTIALRTDESALSTALETKLRAQGFAIDPFSQAEDAFALAYTVTGDSEAIFVRISTPSFEMARAYRAGPSGAEPLTPISLMHRTSG